MIEPLAFPKQGVEYRELTPEEIQTLAPIFEATGNAIPVPAVFVGAVENGKVIGFLVLQQKVHAEPMWIQDGRSQIFQSLAKKAEEVVLQRCGAAYVYLFAPAGKISKLASSMGFQLEPWNVLSRLIMPEPPSHGPVELMHEPSEEEPIRFPFDESVEESTVQ